MLFFLSLEANNLRDNFHSATPLVPSCTELYTYMTFLSTASHLTYPLKVF